MGFFTKWWDELGGDPAEGGGVESGQGGGGADGSGSTDPPEQSPLLGDDSGGGGFVLPAVLRRFAADPKGFILAIVATWVVAGILSVGRIVTEGLLIAGDVFGILPKVIQDAIIGVGAAIGEPITAVAAMINETLVEIAASAGPAAPIVVVAGYVLIAVLLIRGASLLIGVYGRVLP